MANQISTAMAWICCKIFKPSTEEIEFSKRLELSPKTLRVVGRGTVIVDAQEIQNSQSFKEALLKARSLVKKQ